MAALAARLKTFSGMQSISRIHTEKLRLQARLQAAASVSRPPTGRTGDF